MKLTLTRTSIVVGAVLLALAWLIPNHHAPWLAFHSEAWAAAVIALVALSVVMQPAAGVQWTWLHTAIGISTLIPLVQYQVGLIRHLGEAWINSTYLVGFGLAVLVGEAWERVRPNQPGDFLFLSFSLAATLSVPLELFQWLDLARTHPQFDVWIMQTDAQRPFGNVGQPNQLATLLLLGVLGAAWGFFRGVLGGPTAILVAALLLLGISLTQSRTGMLAVVTLVAAIGYWRRLWPYRWFPWVAIALAAFFFAFSLSLIPVKEALLLELRENVVDRIISGAEVRPAVWRMFLDAILERPLFGYGWGQASDAHLYSVLEHPKTVGSVFSHTHNLFLDLLIWNGVPVGLLLASILLWTAFKCFKQSNNSRKCILTLTLTTIGLHALLELPLHYSYFLLPTGLMLGALQAGWEHKRIQHFGNPFLVGIWITGVTTLSISVVDYLRLEDDFFSLRFYTQRIGPQEPRELSHPIVLNQLSAAIQLGYLNTEKLTQDELEWVHKVTLSYPSPTNLFKLTSGLALAGRIEEAKHWQHLSCAVLPLDQCTRSMLLWNEMREQRREAGLPEWSVLVPPK